MMTLFCSLGPWGDEGVAERPPVWGVLYSVCTGRLRHAYHLPHDPSGTVQRTHPTIPLLTSPTPSPSNSHPTKSFPNDTPGTVQHPHSVQHSLPHLSLTPFNIPSSTHLPLQPHPTILKITPQVQFYFLTPTPWWLAHHLLHDAIGNIQHSRLHPTACNYCIIWHVSHWLHVRTSICNVLIVWFDKPMFSICISLSVWPLKNVRVNCFDCGIWSVLGEC